jgi:hypothetical protein
MTVASFYTKHGKKIERFWLVYGICLFVFCLLDWLKIVHYGGWHPLGTLIMTGGLLLQTIATMVTKSQKIRFALLAFSVFLVFFSLTIHK